MNQQNQNRVQFLIQFGYLGHLFHGVQPQKNVPTVGEAIYQCLTLAAKMPPKALQFSARTDKNVHALMNFATCWFKTPFDTEKFLENIKQIKTPGLFSVQAKMVSRSVHARGSALGKHYRYVIEEGCDKSVPKNLFAWQIAPFLNIENMQKAADYLVGEHDYASFQAAGCSAGSTIKKIHYIKIFKLNHSKQIHIDVVGNAFLRKMIRNITGLLVEVGSGLRLPLESRFILDKKNRKYAGITAPAHGLTLIKVELSEKTLHVL